MARDIYSKVTGMVSHASGSRTSPGSGCSGPGGEGQRMIRACAHCRPPVGPPIDPMSFKDHTKTHSLLLTSPDWGGGRQFHSPCKCRLISAEAKGTRH